MTENYDFTIYQEKIPVLNVMIIVAHGSLTTLISRNIEAKFVEATNKKKDKKPSDNADKQFVKK